MSEFMSVFFGSAIILLSQLYLWQIFNEERVKILTIKNILIILLSVFVISINYLYVSTYIKILFAYIVYTITNYFLFRRSLYSSIIITFITHFALIISEFVLLFMLLLIPSNNITVILSTFEGTFIINIIMSVIMVLVLNKYVIDFLKKKLLSKMNSHKPIQSLIILIILIAVTNLIMYTCYYKINIAYMVALNCFSIIVYTIISFKIFAEQNENVNIKAEYDNLLDKSVEYETIIDKSRRDTHENKNDLIVLDGLISPRNKKAKEQLHAMIQDYEKIERDLRGNDNLYQKTLPIPSGGLRGLIYHKLVSCDNLGISYDLRVGRNINSKNFSKMSSELVRQYGKIVGVYLDNAIQAVKDLETKEMDVEIYIEEGNFCILVANNFQGELDVDKLGTMGYSSKGDNHGYGLALVKEILMQNKEITSETSIYMDIMTQVIKIKM